jgi:molecular chaperone GrpE
VTQRDAVPSDQDQVGSDGPVSEDTVSDGTVSDGTVSEDSVSEPGTDPRSDTVEEGAANPEPMTIEELVATLELVTIERDQHLSDLQRVSADFSNFRKQTDKRNAEFTAQAGSRVAAALLPVLDACDAAAQQGADGVEPVAAQLLGVLENAGLEVISDEQEPFDPNRHEAAMTEPADDGQETAIVAEVLRSGYAWNGRVLRAAMVKVKG